MPRFSQRQTSRRLGLWPEVCLLLVTGLALAWGPMVLHRLSEDRPDSDQRQADLVWGVIVMVASVGVAAGVGISRRRDERLRATGMPVLARPIEVAEIGHLGVRRVTFTYEVHGQTYTARLYVPDNVCLAYGSQSTQILHVDPDRPTRVALPNPRPAVVHPPPARAAGTLIAILLMAPCLAVCWGLWSLLYGLRRDPPWFGLLLLAGGLWLAVQLVWERWTRRHELIRNDYFRWAIVALLWGLGVLACASGAG
jgi:hypothetical protein